MPAIHWREHIERTSGMRTRAHAQNRQCAVGTAAQDAAGHIASCFARRHSARTCTVRAQARQLTNATSALNILNCAVATQVTGTFLAITLKLVAQSNPSASGVQGGSFGNGGRKAGHVGARKGALEPTKCSCSPSVSKPKHSERSRPPPLQLAAVSLAAGAPQVL